VKKRLRERSRARTKERNATSQQSKVSGNVKTVLSPERSTKKKIYIEQLKWPKNMARVIGAGTFYQKNNQVPAGSCPRRDSWHAKNHFGWL
jgi:hypothetical protein